MLGLDGDGDDSRGLTLATSLQDQVGTTAVVVVPGRLDKEPSGVNITGLGDGPSSLAISGGAF